VKGLVTPPSTLARYLLGSVIFAGGLAVSASFGVAYPRLGILALLASASGIIGVVIGLDLLRIRVADHRSANRQTLIFMSTFAVSLVVVVVVFPWLTAVLPDAAMDELRWIAFCAVLVLIAIRLLPQMRRGLDEIWAERS
jgi:uncharacterized BrkB/YihY/UPF0761 family membrane protein